MRRRLGDMVLVLEAIGEVKRELRLANRRGEGNIVMSEIFTRLMTLYTLLDITRLKDVVKQIDSRQEKITNKEAA